MRSAHPATWTWIYLEQASEVPGLPMPAPGVAHDPGDCALVAVSYRSGRRAAGRLADAHPTCTACAGSREPLHPARALEAQVHQPRGDEHDPDADPEAVAHDWPGSLLKFIPKTPAMSVGTARIAAQPETLRIDWFWR